MEAQAHMDQATALVAMLETTTAMFMGTTTKILGITQSSITSQPTTTPSTLGNPGTVMILPDPAGTVHIRSSRHLRSCTNLL